MEVVLGISAGPAHRAEAKASENSDSPSILTPLGNLPRYPAWNEEQDPKNHEPVWETQIN